MLARLDKPPCPGGTVKTAEAQLGRAIVAIAPENESRNRRVHQVDGQTPGLADPYCGGGVRSQRDHTEDFQYLFQLLARASMGVVQRSLPAVLVLDAARQRTYPDRYHQ